MGLSASQARLLTITSRKSDCEYQSMRYSHEKIALSRNMTDISNEYENSLNQTKLVYDFYGTHDTSTPLSYSLMMTPSEMNGYMPMLATDASGRVVLSSRLADAARAAGVPQEGLGCTPSSIMRDRFLVSLSENGIISKVAADAYIDIPYADTMGLGSTDLVNQKVETTDMAGLIEALDNNEEITKAIRDAFQNLLSKYDYVGTNVNARVNAGLGQTLYETKVVDDHTDGSKDTTNSGYAVNDCWTELMTVDLHYDTNHDGKVDKDGDGDDGDTKARMQDTGLFLTRYDGVHAAKIAKSDGDYNDKHDYEDCGTQLNASEGFADYIGSTSTAVKNMTLGELLKNNYSIGWLSRSNWQNYRDGNHAELEHLPEMQNWEGWDVIFNAFESVLGVDDPQTEQALAYARSQIATILNVFPEDKTGYDAASINKLQNLGYADDVYMNPTGNIFGDIFTIGLGYTGWDGHTDATAQYDISQDYGKWAGNAWTGEKRSSFNSQKAVLSQPQRYVGYYTLGVKDGTDQGWHAAARSVAGISITNVIQAYLSYFAAAYSGDMSYNTNTSGYNIDDMTGDTGSTHGRVYSGTARTVSSCNFIDDETNPFQFTVVTDTSVNSGDAMFSGYYDALFNQLCARGWTENDKVRQDDYLQEMLKNGMMFLTTCADDGFYYQGNYAANSFIREVTDEDAVARAEAKYNTEKQKINHKEEIIDMKMKNLDTEISSLTTEYDTIKSLISKNIERGFKRYDA